MLLGSRRNIVREARCIGDLGGGRVWELPKQFWAQEPNMGMKMESHPQQITIVLHLNVTSLPYYIESEHGSIKIRLVSIAALQTLFHLLTVTPPSFDLLATIPGIFGKAGVWMSFHWSPAHPPIGNHLYSQLDRSSMLLSGPAAMNIKAKLGNVVPPFQEGNIPSAALQENTHIDVLIWNINPEIDIHNGRKKHKSNRNSNWSISG